jgi:hypothetical protein
MASAIFVTRFTPSPLGHGGEHRAYQVVHELAAALGREQVVTLTAPLWWQAEFAPRRASASRALLLADRLRSFVRRKRRRLAYFAENPLKFVSGADFTTRGYRHTTFVADYEQLAQRAPRPALCVIEYTGFADLLAINARHGLPTLCCPQNLEALDTPMPAALLKGRRYSAALDLANEVGVLAQCAGRLFISQVETGLINGLGLASRYYPYIPVGEIREQFQRIRRERAGRQPAPGLFLMLGSAPHASTGAAFEWFVRHARAGGLPPGVRLVVGGIGTEALRLPGETCPELEIRGWLQQDQLEALLSTVTAALIPQWTGFGALTRIPEFACAGIPIVVSRHPTYALDPPPGVLVLDDDWADWRAALERSAAGLPGASEAEYAAWEARQPKPLRAAVAQALEAGPG